MSTALLIMARAPRAGRVKTRLQPLLGPEGCARLQTELIRHTVGWAGDVARSGWLAFTPTGACAEIRALVPHTMRLFAQEGEDLGRRLRHATDVVFGRHRGPIAVIGTDAPELGPVHVRFAEHALTQGNDASLIPALDGGYALIALARPIPRAFDLPADAWGGPNVLDLTLRALRDGGCSAAVLEPVRDLDTPDDARSVAADPRCPEAIRRLLRGATTA